MERVRLIAAAPVRSASEAWRLVATLLADTLEKSVLVPTGSVSEALVPLKGLGPALIAGGHLEANGIVLVDDSLHLTVRVLTGDAALNVEENLNPVPGGANATDGWIVYLPSTGALDGILGAAVKKSSHLSLDAPPEGRSAEKSEGANQSVIDVNALRRLGLKP